MLQRITYDELARAVHARGWKLKRRSASHWQIVNAPLLVNVYPDTAKGVRIYVAGTTYGHGVQSIEDIVSAAAVAPKYQPPHRRERRRPSRRVKLRLLAHHPYCRWCGVLLTLETATIEHIVPLARGGLDNDNNRGLACKPCNHARVYAVLLAQGGAWIGSWELSQRAQTTAVSTQVSGVRMQLEAAGMGTVECRREGHRFFYRLAAAKGQLELAI